MAEKIKPQYQSNALDKLQCVLYLSNLKMITFPKRRNCLGNWTLSNEAVGCKLSTVLSPQTTGFTLHRLLL